MVASNATCPGELLPHLSGLFYARDFQVPLASEVAMLAWDPLNAKYASLDHPEWVQMERLPLYFWEDPHNHTRYLKWLKKILGIKRITDWYKVLHEDFLNNRGSGFLDCYYGSHINALIANFPAHNLKPWLFQQAPHGYWLDLRNCAEYAHWFEHRKKFKTIEGWYGITQDDVYEMHGAGLLTRFDCSVQRLVHAVYPDHDWKPWLFVQVPNNFWPEAKNRIAYMKWLETKLGYTTPDDWYQVTRLDLSSNRGASLGQAGYKTVELIRELYPNREWLPWKFKQIYQGYWNDPKHRTTYLRWLEKQLGFKTLDDWKKVKCQDFADNYGGRLLTQHYDCDLLLAIRELYPDCNFAPWEFHQTPNGFWDSTENCKVYLEWLSKRIGFKSMEDWYSVKRNQFVENCGTGFLKRFKTPYRALKIAFPDVEWLPWKFENVPVGFWKDRGNVDWYLRWLAVQLGLRTKADWELLSASALRLHHGDRILPKFTLKEIREMGIALMRAKPKVATKSVS